MILAILQIILVFFLVLLVLLQSPGSDSLSGFGGGTQQGLNSMFVGRSPTNFITKLTTFVAAAFIINTLLLVGLTARDVHKNTISDKIAVENKEEDKSLNNSVPFNN